VVPLSDDHLMSVREQSLPAWLEPERVIALAEYGEERKTSERASERRFHPLVQRVTVPSVT